MLVVRIQWKSLGALICAVSHHKRRLITHKTEYINIVLLLNSTMLVPATRALCDVRC
jgi:hypothetical protein